MADFRDKPRRGATQRDQYVPKHDVLDGSAPAWIDPDGEPTSPHCVTADQVNASRIQRALKATSEIRLRVDRLDDKVDRLESGVARIEGSNSAQSAMLTMLVTDAQAVRAAALAVDQHDRMVTINDAADAKSSRRKLLIKVISVTGSIVAAVVTGAFLMATKC